MRLAKLVAIAALLGPFFAATPAAPSVLSEHVNGGRLDLPWVGGFDTPNNVMYARTLDASSPAYANPSGDHTVAVAQNSAPDSGGIIVTSVDPGAVNADYTWEGWIFTGAGETRRGLTVRADPTNDFKTFYMLVIEPGLFQLRFRKFVSGVPTTLESWFATVLPGGSIPANSWHKMKIVAEGNQFRCFFDDFELTTTPVVDNSIASGWVGVYSFRFDLGNVPVFFDDLVLSCLSPVPVTFDFTPNTLNLRSMGRWVTGYIEPAAPYTPADIDIASIRLNGRVPVDPAAPSEIGDEDGDGIPDLMVKFSRSAVQLAVSEGASVPVTVSGAMAGDCFEGTDEIRVLRPKLLAPRGGELLLSGSTTQVRWEVSPHGTARTVALLSSIDDGASWNLEAKDLPNSGVCDWIVPGTPSAQARVAVVQIESSDPSGFEVEGVLSVSEAFVINAPLSVESGGTDFAARGIGNPSTGSLTVSLALPNARPARLSAYDVSGRLIASREVGALGPGRHTVSLAERAPVGLYIIELQQDGRRVTTRMSVVR